MGQVLPFQRRAGARSRATQATTQKTAIEDVGKYAHNEEPDNYRQRMINNGLAFIFCIVLVVTGVWLATTIAQMRKDQDCVLSGRRNCAPLSVPSANPS